MADAKISAQTPDLAPTGDDGIATVNDLAGTPGNKLVTLAALRSAYLSPGDIRGMELAYNSTTVLRVKAGSIAVNGVLYAFSQTDYTSASTMKDVANSTVTIGASKCYFVFAYNNSGTLEIRIEERDGSGDGADPTWSSTLDYWQSASTGANARRIGKFWTNGSSQIIKFHAFNYGRKRGFSLQVDGVIVLSGGTATSYTAVTLTPYVTADDEQYELSTWIQNVSATSAYVELSVDGGTTRSHPAFNASSTAGFSIVLPGLMPNTGTLHYDTQANNTISLYLRGSVCRV